MKAKEIHSARAEKIKSSYRDFISEEEDFYSKEVYDTEEKAERFSEEILKRGDNLC